MSDDRETSITDWNNNAGWLDIGYWILDIVLVLVREYSMEREKDFSFIIGTLGLTALLVSIYDRKY